MSDIPTSVFSDNAWAARRRLRAEANVSQLARMMIARDILERRTLKMDLAGGVSLDTLARLDLMKRRARR